LVYEIINFNTIPSHIILGMFSYDFLKLGSVVFYFSFIDGKEGDKKKNIYIFYYLYFPFIVMETYN
jgi:hypothetical protein